MVVLVLLTLGLATAWADRPSPTREDAPQAVGQATTGTFDQVPALPGRSQVTPLAAAPSDDGDISAQIGAPPGARSTDYYVSTTGSDLTGDGSAGNPWATIQHAIAQVSDTDTIHLASGTYVETRQIVIKISDTGPGMTQETIEKIFDPFFTTKEVGKGTGLGLSISYSIIEKLGGSIYVDSKVGKGTTFTIKLPVK